MHMSEQYILHPTKSSLVTRNPSSQRQKNDSMEWVTLELLSVWLSMKLNNLFPTHSDDKVMVC